MKFELLADVDTAPAGATFAFNACKELGAINLRGTGFAARDVVVHELRARIGGVLHAVEVNVTGLAGFLLAKTAAAHSRRKAKVRERFGDEIGGSIRTGLDDLSANFESPNAQGPQAYATQMLVDHPELDATTLRADAVLAVEEFHAAVLSGSR